MRLQGQAKAGYFPAPPKAIDCVLDRLTTPPDAARPPTILDPCAGEGAALARLAARLGGVPYGIELDEVRGEVLRETVEEMDSQSGGRDGRVLAPADFLRCAVTPETFSLVWCNPPYDYATGGQGRTEWGFLETATRTVRPDGVLALACPEPVAGDYRTLRHFAQHYDDVAALNYPEPHRHYRETVLLGRKRSVPLRWGGYLKLSVLLAKTTRYDLPPGRPPRTFRKDEPTDAELVALLQASSLKRAQPAALRRARPPLPPGPGHRALLLASGYCDGLIRVPGEPPHVVRGTVRKTPYLADETETENADGSTTLRRTYSEKIELVVRALTAEGELVTLLQE